MHRWSQTLWGHSWRLLRQPGRQEAPRQLRARLLEQEQQQLELLMLQARAPQAHQVRGRSLRRGQSCMLRALLRELEDC